MKNILTIFIFFLTNILFSQTCTTISDGTYGNSQTSPLSPIYGLYNYSWSSNIYYASEIGAAKTIESLAWYVDSYQSGYSQTGPYTFNNVQIYFAYTTLSGWGNTNNVSGLNRLTGVNVAQGITSWTKVYDGSITFNTVNAYKTITLTTPFSYNGTSNLVVHVDNNDGSWASGYPDFHYTSMNTSTSQRTMKYGAQDASMGPTSGTRLYARADIRFCAVSALPVELLSFDGYRAGYRNILTWTTATEHNNDVFRLEKGSYDEGINWSLIATIPGAGNSDQTQHYSYFDYEIQSDTSYYRLSQVDFDGNFEIFDIVAIINLDDKNKILIKRINSIGQEIDDDFLGTYFEIYSDGTIKKVIK